jgi:glutamate decarboxylase
MGLAPLGVGWVIWRDVADLPEDLIFWVNYLGGNAPTFGLNFSRPGGAVVAQYYNFLRLGRAGYERVQGANYETARRLAEAVAGMGPFEIIFDGDPARGITAVSWRIAAGQDPGYNLFDLADRLRTRGWLVPAYTLPPDLEHLAIQRVLVRHGLSRDLDDLLLTDMRRQIELLTHHPPSSSLGAAEAGGFTHDATSTPRP